MSNSGVAARETARHADGRFGEQARTAPGDGEPAATVGFYASVQRGSRRGLLLGPFGSLAEAEAAVPTARELAGRVDPMSPGFDSFGVARVESSSPPAGRLNDLHTRDRIEAEAAFQGFAFDPASSPAALLAETRDALADVAPGTPYQRWADREVAPVVRSHLEPSQPCDWSPELESERYADVSRNIGFIVRPDLDC